MTQSASEQTYGGYTIAVLRERLSLATPGPYGFQSYGRRERLVTTTVGDGTGEPFALFNRAEDARAVGALLSAAADLLNAIEIKKRRKVQRMTLHREIMREAAVCSRMKPRPKP